MNAPFDPKFLKGAAWSTEAADLAAIFNDAVQIAVLSRPANELITTYLETAVAAGALGSGFRTSLPVGQRPDLSAYPGLPDLPGRDAFADDLAVMSELYSDLLGCESVGLRVEIVSRAMCPRFHMDHVGIRLLCTYRGPGTQWIDDEGADRSRLGAGAGGLPDEASGLFGPATQVREVAPFAVALLKGSHWQGNAQRGVIHRSPAVEEADFPRVLVAMDPQW